jgi:hypothetical protein
LDLGVFSLSESWLVGKAGGLDGWGWEGSNEMGEGASSMMVSCVIVTRVGAV